MPQAGRYGNTRSIPRSSRWLGRYPRTLLQGRPASTPPTSSPTGGKAGTVMVMVTRLQQGGTSSRCPPSPPRFALQRCRTDSTDRNYGPLKKIRGPGKLALFGSRRIWPRRASRAMAPKDCGPGERRLSATPWVSYLAANAGECGRRSSRGTTMFPGLPESQWSPTSSPGGPAQTDQMCPPGFRSLHPKPNPKEGDGCGKSHRECSASSSRETGSNTPNPL